MRIEQIARSDNKIYDVGCEWLTSSSARNRSGVTAQIDMYHLETQLLAQAGRLLLEYNESTGEIHRALAATSRVLSNEECNVVVSYGGVAVSLTGDAPLVMPVRELRYNAALQSRVHAVLAQVRGRKMEPAAALHELKRIETLVPRHPRRVAVVCLGFAAASLAALLGADAGAVMVAGLATGAGLVVRQQLGQRHFNLLTLPLAAGFLGAMLGGLAIRFGWTHTPELVLIVPSLMLVPGPHLINALLDIVDNYLPMSVARLGLATSILVAVAVGIVAGVWATLPQLPIAKQAIGTDHLNILIDMLLAGIVTLGFAVFYNTAWPHVGMATIGGMVGHGLRFLALEAGGSLEAATLLGGFAVGLISASIARTYKIPVAVIGFAGAVTMMPGMQIYRAFGGAIRLSRQQDAAEASTIAGALGNAFAASIVVSALALGFIIAARAVSKLAGEQYPSTSTLGFNPENDALVRAAPAGESDSRD